MTKSVNLNFHQTFAPEKEHLIKIISISEGSSTLTKEEIFEQTNIPTGVRSGKVVPHIKYAEHMGLINSSVNDSKYLLSRTALGDLVKKEDPYMLEPLTELLTHYFLTSKVFGAALWSYIFRSCVPVYGAEISSVNMISALERHFGTKKINLSPFRTSYLQEKSALSTLSFLTLTTDSWIFSKQQIVRSYQFLYAYTLLEDWEQVFGERTELSLDEISNNLGWNHAYLWDKKTTLDVLDLLADAGIVSINRQLNPLIIIKNSKASEIQLKIYSMLL
ncbi:hypothetical protein [Paenibacillus sp. FSL E2-0201]|uniref:DUF4007 family protein n=1 Tax=Paenibacillus sp. FSL E2-0201 TaxID=2954726 RepID=UPI0030DDAE1C